MRPLAQLLAVLAALGVIAAAISGCGSSSPEATTASRAAAGADSATGAVAVATQAGRNGPVTIMTCTAAGDPACDPGNGAMGPVRQMAFDNGRLFAGSFNGDVLTCDPSTPASCDAIGKVPGITAVAADSAASADAEPAVYVGTTVGYQRARGDLWRCPQATANAACRNVGTPRPGEFVASLAIAKGTVYAGLDDGRILGCTTGASLSLCRTFARPGGGILALAATPTDIVAGTATGGVFTCPVAGSQKGRCKVVTTQKGAKAQAVATLGTTIYAGFSLDAPGPDGIQGRALACTAPGSCTPLSLPVPPADAPAGTGSAAAVTAIAATGPESVWVGQGTVTAGRGQGAVSLCTPGATCATKWSSPEAGVTALTGIATQ